ncbi:MAG: hypothetical protein Kow0065_11920 [Methylomicrobium sp.]
MDMIDGFMLIFGLTLLFSGRRAIKRQYTHTNWGAFEGEKAKNLGWFWITLGLLFIFDIVFGIGLIKSILLFSLSK